MILLLLLESAFTGNKHRARYSCVVGASGLERQGTFFLEKSVRRRVGKGGRRARRTVVAADIVGEMRAGGSWSCGELGFEIVRSRKNHFSKCLCCAY
jgi:hypothetical protein